MKSQLLIALFDDVESGVTKAFARDLADMLQLSDRDRSVCLETLPRIYLAQGPADRKRRVEELASGRAVGRDKLQHALAVMLFLLKAFLNRNIPESDSSFWADDLVELGHLDKSTRPVFDSVVLAIKADVVPQVEPENRRRRAAAGVLPVLSGCGITVEVRSVRKDFYRRGTPIEDFEPHVIDTATVASISIALDEGPFKDIYFQADEDDIDYLINMFQAAKKEMAAIRRFLKLDA